MEKFDVVIIGGGASGLICSILASKQGANVLLLDGNEKLGKKLFITGKGRCNLTNNSSVETHLANIVNGEKFMNSALRQFSPQNCIDFFENNGCKLKTERGNRVFPESDKSSDVIKTLSNLVNENNVCVKLNHLVQDVNKLGDEFEIKCVNGEKYTASSLVVATGGKSYSATGSTGFGYYIAKKFNHNVIDYKPALVPIIFKESTKDIEGLSLKNVVCSIEIDGKIIKSEFGEMLFTDEGVSGPIVLTLSSYVNRYDLSKAKLLIDFKPALSEDTLDAKFVREFNENPLKNLSNYLKTLLPSNFVKRFMAKLNIQDKKLSLITREERKRLIYIIKRFDFSVKMLDNIEKAIITSGGVDLKEINPKTMESKKVSNLYFVGETLNVDALTGGFNLQIAFSTGYGAGMNCFRS